MLCIFSRSSNRLISNWGMGEALSLPVVGLSQNEQDSIDHSSLPFGSNSSSNSVSNTKHSGPSRYGHICSIVFLHYSIRLFIIIVYIGLKFSPFSSTSFSNKNVNIGTTPAKMNLTSLKRPASLMLNRDATHKEPVQRTSIEVSEMGLTKCKLNIKFTDGSPDSKQCATFLEKLTVYNVHTLANIISVWRIGPVCKGMLLHIDQIAATAAATYASSSASSSSVVESGGACAVPTLAASEPMELIPVAGLASLDLLVTLIVSLATRCKNGLVRYGSLLRALKKIVYGAIRGQLAAPHFAMFVGTAHAAMAPTTSAVSSMPLSSANKLNQSRNQAVESGNNAEGSDSDSDSDSDSVGIGSHDGSRMGTEKEDIDNAHGDEAPDDSDADNGYNGEEDAHIAELASQWAPEEVPAEGMTEDDMSGEEEGEESIDGKIRVGENSSNLDAQDAKSIEERKAAMAFFLGLDDSSSDSDGCGSDSDNAGDDKHAMTFDDADDSSKESVEVEKTKKSKKEEFNEPLLKSSIGIKETATAAVSESENSANKKAKTQETNAANTEALPYWRTACKYYVLTATLFRMVLCIVVLFIRL
jgi:hypothetical protein